MNLSEYYRNMQCCGNCKLSGNCEKTTANLKEIRNPEGFKWCKDWEFDGMKREIRDIGDSNR